MLPLDQLAKKILFIYLFDKNVQYFQRFLHTSNFSSIYLTVFFYEHYEVYPQVSSTKML